MSTDADDVALWGAVIQGFQSTNRRLHARIKDVFGLSPAQTETLIHLIQAPERACPMSELSGAAMFTAGGFTKVAEGLVRAGLVERQPSDADRRVVLLALTPAGEETARSLVSLVAEVNRAQVVDVLGRERADALAVAMTDLFRANR